LGEGIPWRNKELGTSPYGFQDLLKNEAKCKLVKGNRDKFLVEIAEI